MLSITKTLVAAVVAAQTAQALVHSLAQGGQCLQVSGTASSGSAVTLGTCNSGNSQRSPTTGQQWVISPGNNVGVQLFGTTLCLDGAANPTTVTTCSQSGSQTWYLTPDGRIAITGGTQCLEASGGNAQTGNCAPAVAAQAWTATLLFDEAASASASGSASASATSASGGAGGVVGGITSSGASGASAASSAATSGASGASPAVASGASGASSAASGASSSASGALESASSAASAASGSASAAISSISASASGAVGGAASSGSSAASGRASGASSSAASASPTGGASRSVVGVPAVLGAFAAALML